MNSGYRWFVCDMDDGILRIEPTRKRCVEWALGYFPAGRILNRWTCGVGIHEYLMGTPNDVSTVYVIREDMVESEGFDLGQQPLHPEEDDPYERVERPGDAV